jgi:indolepyruvate ferredoxin oxidoreductase beta subunit
MKPYRIYLTGVGGQGIIKTSIIIGEAALKKGLNVVMSEIHGMSQRGGSVTTELKIGDADSPIIEKNKADLVISFEPVETLRAFSVCGTSTTIVLDSKIVFPFTVSIGLCEYPDVSERLKKLRPNVKKIYEIDAAKIAEELGNRLSQNIVLLGVASAIEGFPVEREYIIDSIRENFSQRFVEINLEAFESGYASLKSCKVY